jgi:CheY-like chemotaxis protein
VNLIELLDQIVDMFRLQAASKGLIFRHEWPETLPRYVFIDEKRLRQVLINLLSNAIKYTDAGEAALTVRWRGHTAEFTVSDTGVGIAEADQERVFEPFERVGGHGAAGPPGVGLGLTITKVLVALLGGDVSLKSTPGVGSAFTVKLLLSQTPPPVEEQTRGQGIHGYLGRRRRILVTDDDSTHLDLVRQFLQPLGFELSFAVDGESGLDLARSERPDLAIMDIAMPGMDGWTCARGMRELLGEDVAILMVSANAHDFSRGRREDDPHDDYLIKPYEVGDLYERLKTLLDLEWTATPQPQAAP